MFSVDQSQCSILKHETYMTVSKMAKHSAAYPLEVSSCGCLLQKYYGVLGTVTNGLTSLSADDLAKEGCPKVQLLTNPEIEPTSS